jgi:hypothetical protein
MAKNDDVGYRKPPKASQFKRGSSGNPKGRPKGTRNMKTDLAEELQEIIKVSEGGQPRRLSKQRALIKTLMAKALGGDARALTTLLHFVLRIFDPAAQPIRETDISAGDKEIIARVLAKQRAHSVSGRGEGS